jgi:hypothetical protein
VGARGLEHLQQFPNITPPIKWYGIAQYHFLDLLGELLQQYPNISSLILI